MQIPDIYPAYFVFRVRRKILSLPLWHGARWAAWLRFGARHEKMDVESVKGLHPLRHGQNPILPGENIQIRILLDNSWRETLPKLAKVFEYADEAGEFSARTLALTEIRPFDGGTVWNPGGDFSDLCLDTGASSVEWEADRLALTKDWSIELEAPLRIVLPPGMKGARDKERYCGVDFFTSRHCMAHLLAHVRFLPEWSGEVPEPDHCELAWMDMRYNERRRVALGGIVGHIHFSKNLSREAAVRLVWGQYLGAGKNPRFGLGFWRIHMPESCE